MQNFWTRPLAALLVVAAGAAALPALAIDTGGGSSSSGGGSSSSGGSGGSSSTHSMPAAPSLGDARALIKAKNWAGAVEVLKQIVAADSSSADAYNLLGYSYRNLGKYDLAGRAYARALKLDPKHTGALEYQGVLFIKLGQRDKAAANLDKIKTICGTTCEAYKDLAEALG